MAEEDDYVYMRQYEIGFGQVSYCTSSKESFTNYLFNSAELLDEMYFPVPRVLYQDWLDARLKLATAEKALSEIAAAQKPVTRG